MENVMEVATDQGAILERLEGFLGAGEEAPEEMPEQGEMPEEIEGEESEVEESEESEELTEDDDSEVDESKEDAIDEEGEALDLSDLAEYLKLDADLLDLDEDGNLYVKTKVDGEEGRATLDKLIKSYQLEGHLNKQNMEVQELKKALETKQAELEQQANDRLSQLESLSQLAWQELSREYQNVDWQTLRIEDPAEYSAKLADFNQRQAQLQHNFQQIQAEKQQQTQANQGRIQEVLQEEQKKLLNAIPEWKDEKVASQERADLRKFAVGLGYSEEEVNNLIDHRAVVVLRDAMRYRNLQETKPAVKNRVKKAPKLSKPGAAKTKGESSQRRNQDLRKAIKKSGGKTGVVEYLLQSGKV